MRFTEAARRLTGISCPIFGVSWNPGTDEVTEDRSAPSRNARGVSGVPCEDG